MKQKVDLKVVQPPPIEVGEAGMTEPLMVLERAETEWRAYLLAAEANPTLAIFVRGLRMLEYFESCEKIERGSTFTRNVTTWFDYSRPTASMWVAIGKFYRVNADVINNNICKFPASWFTIYLIATFKDSLEEILTWLTSETTQEEVLAHRHVKQELPPPSPPPPPLTEEEKATALAKEWAEFNEMPTRERELRYGRFGRPGGTIDAAGLDDDLKKAAGNFQFRDTLRLKHPEAFENLVSFINRPNVLPKVFKLLKQIYHPDKGGNTSEFQQLLNIERTLTNE